MLQVKERQSLSLKQQQLEEALASSSTPSSSAVGMQPSVADGAPMLPESQQADEDVDMKGEETEHMPGDATPKADSCQEQGTTTAMEVSPVKDEERTQAQERPSQAARAPISPTCRNRSHPQGKGGDKGLPPRRRSCRGCPRQGRFGQTQSMTTAAHDLMIKDRQTPLHFQHRRGLQLRQQCSA